MNRFTDFYNGNCDNAYELLGCHKVEEGVYHFAVWAPNAKAVSVVGDFNNWLVNHDNLELQDGIWQITINGARNGDCYKYAIGNSNLQGRSICQVQSVASTDGKRDLR